jgi:hypothetical protein
MHNMKVYEIKLSTTIQVSLPVYSDTHPKTMATGPGLDPMWEQLGMDRNIGVGKKKVLNHTKKCC